MNCTCSYQFHACGAKYRVSRCQMHKRSRPVTNVFTEESYRRMGSFGNAENYLSEFRDGFGDLVKGSGKCLEIGCGVSPYVGLVKDAGYEYEGCDCSPFACQWMAREHSVTMHRGKIETLKSKSKYRVVIAAHVIEHVSDAEQSLNIVYDLLDNGGLFYMLIPDDSDLDNQDHMWFFNEQSAVNLLESTGFQVLSAVVKRIVKHEMFMYFVARRIN